MKGTKKDVLNYRLKRAKETLEDAHILAEKQKWNSAVNKIQLSAIIDGTLITQIGQITPDKIIFNHKIGVICVLYFIH